VTGLISENASNYFKNITEKDQAIDMIKFITVMKQKLITKYIFGYEINDTLPFYRSG
jgi:hypothetical protein